MLEKTSLKDLLANHSTMIEIKSGKNIYSYGQNADKIYFILNGLVRVFIRDNDQELEIQRQKNGSFVGESAFTADHYSSRAEAYLNTKILEFKVSDLKFIMQKNVSFASKMINNLSSYIEKLENKNKINLPPINKINKKKEIKKEIKDRSGFYLEGHKTYEKKTDSKDEYYLYDKEIECPVCSKKMSVKKIRNSRLRIKKIREDLRPLYKDFNLYNYSILSCSNCLFTARRKDFNNISKSKKQIIKENFKDLIKNTLSNDFKIEFSEPRSINQVLDAHYLALKLYNYIDLNADRKAFLWRELSWIYEDLGENQLSEKASLKALNNLEEFYFKATDNHPKKETNKLSLLLSVLYYKHNQNHKALPLLDELIRDNKVNIRHRNKAKDLFLKIREVNN
ncbi:MULTISPECIES: DUF2225 domain-containing protein [Halanaerobium]|uniref:Cyclic nucleotide-binding domain-containing protein n=1 Tax=Halanaerobium kushneri TaxID=56779 RepID=A0A1N6PD21_9FIRM|nr:MULTISPECIES: DUF2225 domain-containing protein [Halanaerobium]RCW58735.1 hypothetical protein DFR80_10972 [Halanaerobium sp. ST460_2HS_T2]SIQ02072.1 hypothetical protein SAMN05421834_10139 [Halanaerobium kushneri]